jgi:hypothetical protein
MQRFEWILGLKKIKALDENDSILPPIASRSRPNLGRIPFLAVALVHGFQSKPGVVFSRSILLV